MSDSSSKKANTYLQSESQDLRLVFAKVNELRTLNEKLAAYLDPHIANYCQVANIIGHRLVLIAANGSIATQLRFQLADLLQKLRSDPTLQKIQDIQCKVHPGFSLPALQTNTAPKRNMPPLSLETAQIVKTMAESIQDPKLRAIMEKIAGRDRHTTPNNDS